MGALRKPVVEPNDDNVIYLLPPGAARAVATSPAVVDPIDRWAAVGEAWEGFLSHPAVETVRFQAKAMLLIVAVGLVTYVGFVGAYRMKSAAGIDLVPGFSLPKVGPLAP